MYIYLFIGLFVYKKSNNLYIPTYNFNLYFGFYQSNIKLLMRILK